MLPSIVLKDMNIYLCHIPLSLSFYRIIVTGHPEHCNPCWCGRRGRCCLLYTRGAERLTEPTREEIKSNSLHAVSSAGCPIDSLHGLTFGREVYVVDVSDGGGSSLKASSSSTPMASAAPEKKGKGVARQGPPPPRCLVEGCNVDLTGAKAYYCRHKVCGTHSKSPKVVVAGMEQRFCQQCSRFHQLHEFDQGKRSCRRRLACHNERRRKPPPAPPSSHIRRMSSAFHENNNRFRGFLVDFTHPNLPALLQGTRLLGEASDQVHGHQYQSGLGAPSARALTHAAYPCMNDPVFSAPGIPPRTGGSDSSCALSLLSTQPWDSTRKENHRAVSARCSSSVDATEHVGENNCVASCWSSSSTSFEVRVNQVGQHGNGHFSGELELLVQGERQRVGLDPSEINLRAIHWSL